MKFFVDASSYPGVAMNYPATNASTAPDMAFSTPSVPFATDGNTTGTLLVRDYGATGTISISVTAGKTTYSLTPIKLPVDNGFGLPAAGWPSVSNHIDATNLHADQDIDDQPSGQSGDGLSNFEEYRGFVVATTHVRTDPHKRDIFVAADPHFMVGTVTTVTTTLPYPVRYVDLSEVGGEDYPARAIQKGKAVIDPNRAGVPGARADGQRAVRLVYQTQYPPAINVEVSPGVVQPVAVWQAGVFGATILDSINPELIDQYATGQPVTAFHAESPDTTRWSEVYERTFTNAGIATNFTHLLYLDKSNHDVPPCPSIGDIPGCDEYDFSHNLVLPRIYPGGIFELHSVPFNDGSDWYSKRVGTCGSMSSIIPYGFPDAEMQAARSIVGAHELGHSLHIDHTFVCGNLMFDFGIVGIGEVTMIDIRPLPAYFASDEIAQIQLHP